MAIAYEGTSSSTNSETCNVPAGTADGDLLIAIAVTQGVTTITQPSGWTEVVDAATYSTQYIAQFSYIIVSGTPPASYTWNSVLGTCQRINIFRYSGVGSVGGASVNQNGASTSNTAPSVTPDVDGCLLAIGYMGYKAGGVTPPTGYTERMDYFASGQADCEYCDQIQTTAAATGSKATGGWTSTLANQIGVQLWARPATAAGNRRRRFFMGIT